MSISTPQRTARTNRLAATTSPYLQQHAHNPVDWWPWCDEVLELAREQDKPILLSIGYSACHWCHVMAHESFEDPATAELMNRLFVNIKVDREERPDLDRVYQTAHQLLTQRAGGWPLTVFLTPEDHTPFFAGTYFPPEPRHGLPSFAQLLTGVEQAYREKREAIREQNAGLIGALEELEPSAEEAVPGAELLDMACDQLAGSFDAEHGGFGDAPKFPLTTSLELLMRRQTGGEGAVGSSPRAMATSTLERMIRGGIMDQLGGGFCRYSVDAEWMIPHFEKMLYDNGPLLALCCDAYTATDAPLFRRAAQATADWVMREMQSPEGGYYSTLDADSDGHEGRFYVWGRDEVKRLLAESEYGPFAAVYGLDRPPNFEGHWHLHGYRAPEEVADSLGMPLEQVEALLASARATLFAARQRRTRPGCDDKVLTAWNGLMIKGMARAARVLERSDYLESAEGAMRFIRSALWRDGRLLATYRAGVAHLSAYLDDYANLIDASLELLQTRWSSEDLDFAISLAEVLLDQFHDTQNGGFWLTGHGHEPLIQRPKPLGDDSMPAGNGIAAQVLQRLGHLVGEPRYLEAAADTLKLAAESVRRLPYAHASLLIALDEQLRPPETIVIRAADDRLETWQRQLQAGYQPRRLVFAIPSSEVRLPGMLSAMSAGERPRIYRCMGTHCEPPVDSPAALMRLQ